MADSKLWHIGDFDEGPHWCAAIVRAGSAEEAREVLAAAIRVREPETVWSPLEPEDWAVSEVPDGEAVVLILGAGCR